mgnify:CR=1 FL=1
MSNLKKALLVLVLPGSLLWLLLPVLPVAPLALAQESIEDRRAKLQAELEEEEKQIAHQSALLRAKQSETATVKGDIDLLKSQIAEAKAGIAAKRVAISRLDDEILARQGKINTLEAKIKREQESLAELLRQTREVETVTLPEIVLDSQDLSDFFLNVERFVSLQTAVHTSLSIIRETQTVTHKEKVALEGKKDQELDAQQAIEYKRKQIERDEAEKQRLLTISKGQEKAYAAVLAERQKRAAQIRAALFALRDTAAIPFGKALEYATAASKVTGVRPAFVLAILQQESNLGQNVGSCVITNLSSGETKSLKSGRVFANGIHPMRDLPSLRSLLSELGRDPLSTNVSCPQAIGYGGAMGPAQFIPSTWNLMRSDIALAVGTSVPDPWIPQHAFMASSLYLRDLGAAAGTYSAEMNAACRYYSGKSCSAGNGAGYGSSVMSKATDIQLNMIDLLQNI